MLPERAIVALLRELANERGLELLARSGDWILRLRDHRQVRWVFGYDFDLNPACAMQLAGDKAATAMALEMAGVPHVPHALFHSPEFAELVPREGTFAAIRECAGRWGFDVVVKPNEGTGGADVHRVTTPKDLERVAQRLFVQNRTIAVSPFVEIDSEHRIVVLDQRPLLAYRKSRIELIGDGRSSRLELLARRLERDRGLAATRTVQEVAEQQLDLSEVPSAGERWTVNWKHNLGRGGSVEVLQSGSARADLEELAIAAAAALSLRFCSVDVVADRRDGKTKVLEVNSGVMMESFALLVSDGRDTAKRIYAQALDAMFATDPDGARPRRSPD